jgi:1-aminocyclopropane-1-carboxylate deaminase
VIRGEEHLPLNPILAGAVVRGMRLTYLDRTTYREKRSA